MEIHKQWYTNKATLLFMILGGFFITNALIAELIGIKIFSLEKLFGLQPFNMTLFGVTGLGFDLTAGVILWPVVFIMTDIINEYFGRRGVQMLSWMAVVMILYAFLMFFLGIHLPANDWWQSQSGIVEASPERSIPNMDLAFKKIFGQGLWIIIGSMVAFLLGQLVDVVVFHWIRKRTGEKYMWLRATGSTLVSQFIDSFVVLIVAFYIGSNWDLVRVLAIGCVNYMYKSVMAVILTPLIYLGHDMIERFLGHDLAHELKTLAANQ
ncbi:MAG: queuosine precursor transporter [Saprospiraceae bacterium]|nr:queuosine precursor transporter [Saprospiraceae bacterium]MCB9318745.1 queuosine precursor transporter [Lewinellaceae bacterium]